MPSHRHTGGVIVKTKMKKNGSLHQIYQLLLKYKLYVYPALIVFIFIVLVIFRISGSSIGVYHNYLYGDARDSNLIYGKPRPIRSDEWLVATQLTIAQKENNFGRFNFNVLGGQDMSLLVNAPYKDWSAVFKPENFSFFVLPFEYAFAFKWWIMLVALLISSYLFALKVMERKVLLSILFSLVTSFAPFVFWWYQLATIGPLVYGFLILIVGMSLIDKTSISIGDRRFSSTMSAAVKAVLFTYLLSCFALVFYPPFQIVVALCVAFYLVGYLLNQKLTKKDWISVGSPVLCSLFVTGLIIGTFALTRIDALNSITGTVYPGKRVVATGHYDPKTLLVTYLQPFLQSNSKGSNYIANQSESSNFILTPFHFLIPFISLFIWLYVKRRRFDWVLFMLILCNSLFLMDLFIPGTDIVIHPFFLHIVPHERLLIGLGFLTLITLVYAIKVYSKADIKLTKNMKITLTTYIILLFATLLWAGLQTRVLYPHFVSSRIQIFSFALILIASISLLLFKRFRLGMGVMATLSIASVVYIHPLYIGLGPIYNNQVTQAIKSVSPQNSLWASAEDIMIEHLPQISGRHSITGVSAYPNNAFWKQYSESKDDWIYNRYAHIMLLPNLSKPLTLVGPDNFAASENCSTKLNAKIDFIVSTKPLHELCDKLIKTVTYPNIKFYLYKH